MFERFTNDARAAVTAAQEEARALGHDSIGTEHLLLALANRDSGPAVTVVPLSGSGATYERIRDTLINLAGSPTKLLSDEDAAALASIGIDLQAVLDRVEESFGPGAFAPKPGRVRFSKSAKTALELTVREALRVKTGQIAAEHLLLGLMRDKNSMAARILEELGIDLAQLRGVLEASLLLAA
jgi:ATP-dependent Clp protease ATP-binding subunit ClpA